MSPVLQRLTRILVSGLPPLRELPAIQTYLLPALPTLLFPIIHRSTIRDFSTYSHNYDYRHLATTGNTQKSYFWFSFGKYHKSIEDRRFSPVSESEI